jgi:hypothetical protein
LEFLDDVLKTAHRQEYNTNYNSKILEQLNDGLEAEASVELNYAENKDSKVLTLKIIKEYC